MVKIIGPCLMRTVDGSKAVILNIIDDKAIGYVSLSGDKFPYVSTWNLDGTVHECKGQHKPFNTIISEWEDEEIYSPFYLVIDEYKTNAQRAREPWGGARHTYAMMSSPPQKDIRDGSIIRKVIYIKGRGIIDITLDN